MLPYAARSSVLMNSECLTGIIGWVIDVFLSRSDNNGGVRMNVIQIVLVGYLKISVANHRNNGGIGSI